jgi:ethanolamine utilization protein EutN
MQIGEVIGHAVATVKHPTLQGIRLLLVQLLGADGGPDGEPVLALDGLGASPGAKVIVTTDALGVRELAKSKNSPARYSVQGLCDR